MKCQMMFILSLLPVQIPILNTPPVFLYILAGMVMAIFNVCKTIPACISPGAGKNGSTIAVSSWSKPNLPTG